MAVPSLKRCQGIKRKRREFSARPKHQQKLPAIGTLHPCDTDFSLLYVVDAYLDGGGGGMRYGLNVSSTDSIPAVVSCTTGKTWTVGWDELIALAIAAGIDREGD